MVSAGSESIMRLRSVGNIRPMYVLPDDPLVDEALIPNFAVSLRVDSMMGFFTSSALVDLAPGLATFLTESEGVLRLVISPVLKDEDVEAIRMGIDESEVLAIVEQRLSDLLITPELIERHTLECLSWLIRQRRVEIKVALMREGMFHPKVWLFSDGTDTVAIHGSSNWTGAGIGKNVEQIAVSQSWSHEDDRFVTDKLTATFENFWAGRDANSIVVSMPEAVERKLLRTYRAERMPQESDLRDLYQQASKQISDALGADEFHRPGFEIPNRLQFEEGEFAHQGEAVQAWLDSDGRGVLEMATGSGKTITALISARRLFENRKPMLMVIAAPYIPLIQQWADEMRPFGLHPLNMSEVSGRSKRAELLGKIKWNLRLRPDEAQAIVVSHDTLCDGEFQSLLANLNCTKLLVADEVHNLGRPTFISNPPEFFDYRLGLSATPERQYDEAGTEKLFSFFGPPVFSFTLEQAIGKCLVEYDYYIHPVELTIDELERWYAITDSIRKNRWREKDGSPDSYLNKLYRDRRAILENAENKVAVLSALLESEPDEDLRHTLVYTSDKDPTQMDQVNKLLDKRGLLYHQLTHEETRDRELTARILESFQRGGLSVLTAKRVLDEGVNIPQIRKAFILASTTVERQWVQRRGRLLRQCPEIGKTHSEIHDFIIMPPGGDKSTERSLARSELLRAQEFASLARNAGAPDGPLDTIAELVETAYY